MNKRNKIIVSIVGITIVLLALLGMTYAYYLTRIQGNTNTNSISITTADLKLEYGDGNEIITASNIVPNTTIAEKTFTVTNTGNNTIKNYRVVLEYALLDGVVPSVFKYPNDFEIKMTCVSKNIETNEVSGTCNGYTGYWNNESFEMQKNTIAEGIRHEYSLIIKYIDSGIDQSDDMGKNLNLKVQIYGELDTSTLDGTVIGVDSTYAIRLNSKPKVSSIVNGNYKFIGVEPGEHTLTLINQNGEEISTETITINKGTEARINGSTITVKENQSIIHLTTSSSGTTLSSTATFNPYSDTSTLAYNIITNAMTNANGTIYSDNPITTPAVEISGVTDYKTTGEVATYTNSMSNMSSYTNSTWYYYDTYEVDEITGEFTLSGKKSCTYNSTTTNNNDEIINCYDDMVNKYLYDSSASNNINSSNHTSDTKTNLSKIYKITATTSLTLSYAEVFNSPDDAERVLVPTIDDYGLSYYYRGDVEDNYVNFAGMCWRIVRIEGDGSIKIILEDSTFECNNVSFSGNWSDGNTYVFGYDNNSRVDFINYSGGLADSFKTFQNTLAKKINTSLTDASTQEEINTALASKLKIGEWCYDDKVTLSNTLCFDEDDDGEKEKCYLYEDYGAYTRIYANKKPSLTCTGTKITKFKDGSNMYVGTLTADEIVFAGATGITNYNYYLINNFSRQGSRGLDFWMLSPYAFNGQSGVDRAFHLNELGSLYSTGLVNNNYSSRPTISLKTGSVISNGNGTIDNPYVIN